MKCLQCGGQRGPGALREGESLCVCARDPVLEQGPHWRIVTAPSSQPLGSIWGCRRCPSKTFQSETAASEHALLTNHQVYPVLQIRPEERTE